MFKKINAFLAALTITATAAGMLPANAEENYSATTSTTQDTKPSKVDLSKDYEINLLFPEIENQGSTSSCVSFTTAYYQFTYEARKAYFDKYGVIPNFRISPAFVFNHLNYGENEGSFLNRAYDFLENMGALTWEDAPFEEEGYDYSYQEGRPEMLCKALKMRISNVEKAMKSNTEDDRMEDLKQKLREGKVIATSSYFKLFDNDMAVTIDPKTKTVNKADAEFVYMQCNKKNDTGGWHAITIVGYDDDIEYTYKGKIYKGAFKVANSWGDDWGDNGHFKINFDMSCGINDKINLGYIDEYLNGTYEIINFVPDYTFYENKSSTETVLSVGIIICIVIIFIIFILFVLSLITIAVLSIFICKLRN